MFEDDKHAVYLYNAFNDQVLALEEVTSGVKGVLWDTADPNLLLLSDGKTLSVYIYMPTSLDGPCKILSVIHLYMLF